MMPKCQSCQVHDNAVSRGDENVCAQDEMGTIAGAAGMMQLARMKRGGVKGGERFRGRLNK